MSSKRVVLITGCSIGGLGDALAQAFHAAPGIRVIATARNLSKVAHLEKLGIETLKLDVLSPQSIQECVENVSKMTGGRLDILLNNSGAGYSMTLADASIEKGQELFELNVWAVLRVTQAFIPLLMESDNGMIVNNTSIASVITTPLMGIYNASKAAIASMTGTLRAELKPFGIKVIDMKTGAVKSQFFDNQNVRASGQASTTAKLPEDSIYAPARAEVEAALDGDFIKSGNVERDVWAKSVVHELLKTSPSPSIWKGGNALLIRIVAMLPQWMIDFVMTQAGFQPISKKLNEHKQKIL